MFGVRPVGWSCIRVPRRVVLPTRWGSISRVIPIVRVARAIAVVKIGRSLTIPIAIWATSIITIVIALSIVEAARRGVPTPISRRRDVSGVGP